MTRRAVAIGALLWLALASSIAAGIVAGSLISAATVRAAVVPASSGAMRVYDARPDGPEPSPSLWWPGTPTGKRPAVYLAPAAAMTPAGTTTPAPARALPAAGVASGIASTYGPGWTGALAVPEGPGVRVRVCGPGGCVVRISTDAGPDLAMQRAGRVVDLDVPSFELVCGCGWRRGLVRVTVERLP